jgi:Methylamine utilisation protein MauE
MSDLGLSASVAVAAVLVMAAIPKLRDGKAFHLIVREFGVVPARLTVPVARALPIAEVLLAAGLIVPLLRRGSAIAAAISDRHLHNRHPHSLEE